MQEEEGSNRKGGRQNETWKEVKWIQKMKERKTGWPVLHLKASPRYNNFADEMYGNESIEDYTSKCGEQPAVDSPHSPLRAAI